MSLGLAVVGIGIWGLLVLPPVLRLADSPGDWLIALGLGVVGPVLLLWQVNRALSQAERIRRSRDEARRPEDRTPEREVLRALTEHGELTPVSTALRTSSTAAPSPIAQLAPPEPADTPCGPSGAAVLERLSEREREVLALLATGRSNRQIADALVLSIGTVKAHTNSIYRKLAVGNRTEAIARARALAIA